MALRVMMMGGRRCGKTSALASIFHEMINNKTVNEQLTVCDRTVLRQKINKYGEKEWQESLTGKKIELMDFFPNEPTEKTFLIDKGPTNCIWNYNLGVKIPGTPPDKMMDIEFLDAPGEFFNAGTPESQEVSNYVQMCDVFIVMVDTPYLMGEVEEHSKDICRKAINLGTNRVEDIHNFLTHINDNDGKDGKMVIFVPVKCEKWAKEGRLDEVVARVESVYNTHITALSQYSKMSIAIIPILTAGNILFEEFREAEMLVKAKIPKKTNKCCSISDKIVRLADGTHYRLREGDIVNVDAQAIIDGTDLQRPYAWYRLNQDPNDFGYNPQFCEQLPLHILKFMVDKYFWTFNNPTGLLGWFKKKWDLFFGNIDPKKLQETISQLSNGMYPEGACIKYIKTAY